jgi:hypothetical protein
MKKLILAVAVAVSNFISAQTFNITFNAFYYFNVPSSNSSNFKVENQSDVFDLLYQRNMSYEILLGPNDVQVSKNKLINHTQWNEKDTVIHYKNFNNYKFIDNVITFTATGYNGTDDPYIEHFYFDLNELDKSNRDMHTTFAVSYWYLEDGSIEGIIITNGVLDSFSKK